MSLSDELANEVRAHLELGNFSLARSIVDSPKLDAVTQTKLFSEISKKRRDAECRTDNFQVAFPIVLEKEATGAVVGLRLENKPTGTCIENASFKRGIEAGVEAAWGLLVQDEQAPLLEPVFTAESVARITRGGSCALAAAIEAFRVLTSTPLQRNTVATGELSRKFELVASGYLQQKIEATAREHWGGEDSVVLIAQTKPFELKELEEKYTGLNLRIVKSLEEVLTCAFGKGWSSATVQPEFVSGKNRYREVCDLVKERRFNEALTRADEADTAGWKEPLPTQLAWTAARAALHLGNPDAGERFEGCRQRARELHEVVWDQNEYARFLVDDIIANQIDQYELETASAALGELLDGTSLPDGKLTPESTIDIRGTLAQVFSMAGEHAKAIRTRSVNLNVQNTFDGYEDTLARTHCNLAWERFRGSAREEDIEGALDSLAFAERAVKEGHAEQYQPIFNLYARLRIHLHNGNHKRTINEFERGVGVKFIGELKIDQYPGCLIATVYGAALVEAGQHEEGRMHLKKIRTSLIQRDGERKHHVHWLVHLGLGWEILALQKKGREEQAQELSKFAADRLGGLSEDGPGIYPPAARWHQVHAPLTDELASVGNIIRQWYRASWY